MAHRLPITIKLESFEGPLDLLLYLIQSHELDLSRISIGRITDQYLAYVQLMQELNFDIASEFLVMAATLLHWKSKTLLPQEDKAGASALEDDLALSQEDLIRQLLEHRRFSAAGEELARLPKLGEDVFSRPNRRPPIERIWAEMNITKLATSYQDMLVRARRRKTVLKKETVSLTDRIVEFSDRLKLGELTSMKKLLSAMPTKPEVVVTFLASLELARLRKLKLYQEVRYEEIYLELIEAIKDFDLQLARGFDHVVERINLDISNADTSRQVSAPAVEEPTHVNA